MNSVTNFDSSATKTYRYDLFKGVTDPDGTVSKVRSVGSAYLEEGQGTFLILLKTFLDIPFYMLPEKHQDSPNSYVIVTRELSRNPRKKYFWNPVGEARVLGGNQGLMQMSWDLLSSDLYLSMQPIQVSTDTRGQEQLEKVAS